MTTKEKEFWSSVTENTPDPAQPLDVANARFRFSTFLHNFARDAQVREDADLAFAARLTKRVKHKYYDTRQRFAMAVSIEPGTGLVLHVSLPWFSTVPLWEASLVLQHEVRHITMRDVPRGMRMTHDFPTTERGWAHAFLINPAMDCAVNSQLLIRSPHMAVMEHSPPILPDDYDLPRGHSSEWYLARLVDLYEEVMDRHGDILDTCRQILEQASNTGSPGNGQGQGDGGSDGSDTGGAGGGGSGESDGADPYALTSALANAVAQAHAKIDKAPISRGAKRMLHNGLEHMLRRTHVLSDVAEASSSPEMVEIEAMLVDRQIKSMEIDVLRSMEKVTGIGQLPKHLQSRLTELTHVNDVAWDRVLRQHVQARLRSHTRTTMTRPNRRRFIFTDPENAHDVTLLQSAFPGRYKDRRHAVLFCVDVSGSMNSEAVLRGMEQTYSLLRSAPGVKLYVAQMDTQIAALEEVQDVEDFKRYVRQRGRAGMGGTSCADLVQLVEASWGAGDLPPMHDKDMAVARSMSRIDACVYFTDGYLYFPKSMPRGGASWIWCLTRDGGDVPDDVPGVRIRVK